MGLGEREAQLFREAEQLRTRAWPSARAGADAPVARPALTRRRGTCATEVDTENQQKEGLKTAIHDLRVRPRAAALAALATRRADRGERPQLRVEEFAPRIKQLVEQENQMAERLVVSRAGALPRPSDHAHGAAHTRADRTGRAARRCAAQGPVEDARPPRTDAGDDVLRPPGAVFHPHAG